MEKRFIKKIIENYINEVFENFNLLEQDDEDSQTPELDLGGADTGGDEGGDTGELDLGGGETGGEDLGNEGEDGTGDLEGEGDDGDLSGDGADDLGGGSFGGGGGFGGSEDLGGEEDNAGEEDTAEEEGNNEPEEVELPDDPIQAAVDIAIDMLDETGDDNRILSAVKGSIQRNFENFEDAVPVITSLWQTEHPVLKVVARKLLTFIQGK